MAIDNALITKILNATSPTGASGIPGTYTALSNGAMKVKLTSTTSTNAASGTEITGTGYTANGTALANAVTASSAGSNVTLPGAALTWTNGTAGAWTIVSFELLDAANARTWWGNFTGAPVSVAAGNSFQIAIGGVTLSLT
jgi:hypothetical protein